MILVGIPQSGTTTKIRTVPQAVHGVDVRRVAMKFVAAVSRKPSRHTGFQCQRWKKLKLSNQEEKPTSSPKWQKRSTNYEIADNYSEKNELHCLVLMSDKIGGASFTIGSESAIVKEFKELTKYRDAFKNILNKLKQL